MVRDASEVADEDAPPLTVWARRRRTHATRTGAARRLRLIVAAALAVGSMSSAQPARAHQVFIGQSKIHQNGDRVDYELAVNNDELVKRVVLGSTDPPEHTTPAERAAVLRRGQEALEGYLISAITIRADGVDCVGSLEETDVLRHRGEVFAVLSLAYQCAEPSPDRWEVAYDVFFDATSDAERSSHANIADYRLGDVDGRFVFEPGDERLTVGERDAGPSAGGFLVLGFEHILAGIDHVLFVVVLLLGAASIKDAAKLLTAFTAAHSVTLALSALDLVRVPAIVVEPLIALSIAYVAIENVLRTRPQHRPAVVFGFGLMHGLGFAGALSFTNEPDWRLLLSLATFNFGVEIGQAVIVAVMSPLLLAARRLHRHRVLSQSACGLIAAVGILWVVQRLLLA